MFALGACGDHVAAPVADASMRMLASRDAAADAHRPARVADDRDAGAADDFPPIVRRDASSPQPSPHPDVLRIVDWNIKAGLASSIAQITERLKSLEPDVITLQEVDDTTYRSGQIDQPAYLASAFQFNYAFAETIPWFGGQYGIASMTRYPFASVRRIPLSNQYAAERRTALETIMCIEQTCLRIVNHHADTEPLASSVSIKEIVDDLTPELGSGVVFTGDLNQAPTDLGPVYTVGQGFTDVGAQYGDLQTEGGRRIDYALLDAKLAGCVKNMMTLEDATESDHTPIVVDIDWSCAAKR